jgi:hypothetical protein
MSVNGPKHEGILEVLSPQLDNGSWLCRVSINHLNFPDYQRGEIKHHTRSIANEWRDEFARPLSISLNKRLMNCFDGKQTSTAASYRGIDSLIAFVWVGWSYEQEAKAFYVWNSVPKGMNGWKKFVADMRAGNHKNQLILDCLSEHGLTTPVSSSVAKENHADIPKSGIPLAMMAEGHEILVFYSQVMRNWKKNGSIPETAKATDFGRGLKTFLVNNFDKRLQILRALKTITPDQIRSHAKDFESSGRIDQSQIRQAFEALTSCMIALNRPRKKTIRKAA